MTKKSEIIIEEPLQEEFTGALSCAVCHSPLSPKTRKTRVLVNGMEGLICGKAACAKAGAIPRPDAVPDPAPKTPRRPRCPSGRRQRKNKR